MSAKLSRRSFLAASGGLSLAAAASPFAYAKGTEMRPNVLFIMTDQQFADATSCRIGQKFINTPAMDSLAADGTFFGRSYCSNPLCVPSRSSMFTGRYPAELDIQTNGKEKLDPKKTPCLGTLFHEAGYETGYFGKWHLPFNTKDKAAHGFQNMENIRANGADKATPGLADKFLKQKRDKPFMLVTSFNNPHNICEWARGQKLPDGPIGDPPPADQCPPLKPNHQPPQNETDIMTFMRKSYQSAHWFPVGNFDEDKWRQFIWAYYRLIEKVDAGIGQVLKSLREAGQEENTLIAFVSDHGDCHGAHKWNQKTVFYDESTRVPLIIRQPGVTAKGTSNRLVNTGIDLMPTLCDYAGITAPKGLKGTSLKATANGKSADDPREFVVVSNKMVQCVPVNGVSYKPAGRMVRSRRYKYFVMSEGKRRESLVDMEKDPGETVNLAGTPDAQAELVRHRKYLSEWCGEIEDRFPLVK